MYISKNRTLLEGNDFFSDINIIKELGQGNNKVYEV